MSRTFRSGMLVLALAGSSFLASCSSKITAEQLAKMKELRNRERALKQEIADLENKMRSLDGEISARQREVDDCNTRKQFVQSKLAQWPNSWPAGLFDKP